MAPRVEAILLAAGESRRMGHLKPLLRVGELTFVERLTGALLEAVSRVVVVLGAGAEEVRRALPSDSRVVPVENPDYRRGQMSSLRIGLGAISDYAGAAIVHLSDHPLVSAATFCAVVEEYRRGGGPIVIARYRGKRGHPVLFSRLLFAELMSVGDEQGARAVVDREPARVTYIEVEDRGVTMDLDTPADLERAGLKLPSTA